MVSYYLLSVLLTGSNILILLKYQRLNLISSYPLVFKRLDSALKKLDFELGSFAFKNIIKIYCKNMKNTEKSQR